MYQQANSATFEHVPRKILRGVYCLLVCLWFCVPLENFSLIWRRHHYRSCNNVALPYFTFWWLQFRRISTVAQKYFDALPCFSHDIFATLSRNCKYTSHLILLFLGWMKYRPILSKTPLSVKLHCHVHYRETWGFANYPNKSICKTYYFNW